MRPTPLPGLFGDLTRALVGLSPPEPSRDTSPPRQRPCSERIAHPTLAFSVTRQQDCNRLTDRIFGKSADADSQREGLQQRSLGQDVQAGTNRLGQNRDHTVVFLHEDYPPAG